MNAGDPGPGRPCVKQKRHLLQLRSNPKIPKVLKIATIYEIGLKLILLQFPFDHALCLIFVFAQLIIPVIIVEMLQFLLIVT